MKFDMRNALEGALYTRPDELAQNQLEALIRRNCQICGLTEPAFVYRSVTYSLHPNPNKRVRTPLSPELVPELCALLEQVKELDTIEKPIVMGYIGKVLNSSNNPKDYLRVLPIALHSHIQTLVDLYTCDAKSLTEEQVWALTTELPGSAMLKQRLFINLLE